MLWGKYVEIAHNPSTHSHDMYELIICLCEGPMSLIHNKEFYLDYGRMLFFPGGVIHGGLIPKGKLLKEIFFCFDRNHFLNKGYFTVNQLLNQLTQNQSYYSELTDELAEENAYLAKKALGELEQTDSFSEEMAESYISQLLINFARSLQLKRPDQSANDQNTILELCKKINQSPECSSPLEIAAKSVGLSRTGFIVKFKQLTGLTYNNYVNQAKVKKAVKLCENPKLSITEIAIQSGFSNLGHFHKKFKSICHMTPYHFQKAIKSFGPFVKVVGNEKNFETRP